MMVHDDPDSVRNRIAADVEQQARRDGIQTLPADLIHQACVDRISAAFIKARLCPKDMNSNQRRIAADYATVVANRLVAA